MEKFKKSFSLRRKKSDKTLEEDPNNKPVSWQEDEKKVREGCCSFQVKYLGFIEVFDSRGMQVCEEAIKALRRPKKKSIRSILYISGDTIRVSDEISKGLVVDQTIEKVSFCSPDRNHKRGFAYICRDGTTRRWMCHAFLAMKETGERLSHAVGCAFTICLEKKQKRESDSVNSVPTTENRTFQKGGSFRQTSLTERLQDPQSAIIAEPPPASMPPHSPSIGSDSPSHIPRPHASVSFFSERQTSLRMFPKLQNSSPFKRELSLRVADSATSSPVKLRTEKFINEERHDNDNKGSPNETNRLSAFTTFSKNMTVSDSSASASPAQRMSFSSNTDSPIQLHSNPFLLSGAINYGASSTSTSQEGINENCDHKNNSVGNGSHLIDTTLLESFQKPRLMENIDSHPINFPTNGFPLSQNIDNIQNIWQNRSPLDSINVAKESLSTNPWSDPSFAAHSEIIQDPFLINQKHSSPKHCSSGGQSFSFIESRSDPFDVSWILNKDPISNDGGLTQGILSSNPFFT